MLDYVGQREEDLQPGYRQRAWYLYISLRARMPLEYNEELLYKSIKGF